MPGFKTPPYCYVWTVFQALKQGDVFFVGSPRKSDLTGPIWCKLDALHGGCRARSARFGLAQPVVHIRPLAAPSL